MIPPVTSILMRIARMRGAIASQKRHDAISEHDPFQPRIRRSTLRLGSPTYSVGPRLLVIQHIPKAPPRGGMKE